MLGCLGLGAFRVNNSARNQAVRVEGFGFRLGFSGRLYKPEFGAWSLSYAKRFQVSFYVSDEGLAIAAHALAL